jgi:hypothetical protein
MQRAACGATVAIMPFAFWLPRLKKIIEMGGSFRKRTSGTT